MMDGEVIGNEIDFDDSIYAEDKSYMTTSMIGYGLFP